jgi:hypothetical protein
MMKRDGKFRDAFLMKIGAHLEKRVEASDIHTQVRLTVHGQADILIEPDGPHRLCMIVEVKTESYRGMTGKQHLLDHPASYQRWLEQKMATGSEAWLVFLIPASWNHRREVKQEIEGYKQRYKTKAVRVGEILWEDVWQLLLNNETKNEISLAYEFRLVLEERFGPIGFDEQETMLMFKDDFPMKEFLKLNAVLDGIGEKARKASSIKKSEKKKRLPKHVSLEIEKDAAGFCLPNSNLWIGYWLPFWNAGNPFPICFGVEDVTSKLADRFKKAFYDEYKEEAKPFGGYTMGWVPKDDFEDANAIEKIWPKLERIWDAVAKTTQ